MSERFSGDGDRSRESAPAQAPAASTQAPSTQAPSPQAPVQQDPVFRSLPREIQKMVEAGEVDLNQATQMAASQGGRAGQSRQLNAVNSAAQVLGGFGPQPVAGQQSLPVAPAQPGNAGPQRLTAGQALEGGRSGKDTFARPGQSGFGAFAGQEFNPNLLRPDAGRGALVTAQSALQAGNVGRGAVGGNPSSSSFLKDINQQV